MKLPPRFTVSVQPARRLRPEVTVRELPEQTGCRVCRAAWHDALYQRAHIPNAQHAGPGNSDDGMLNLKSRGQPAPRQAGGDLLWLLPLGEMSRYRGRLYPVVLGDAKFGNLYGGVLGLPLQYLVGADGKILAIWSGETPSATLDKGIAAALKKISPG
jgi:hypothetical protein